MERGAQAFEDTYSIKSILRDGGVVYGALEQKWTTECVARAASQAVCRNATQPSRR